MNVPRLSRFFILAGTILVVALFQNCGMPVPGNGVGSAALNSPSGSPTGPSPNSENCIFNGSTVASGQSVTAYLASSVPSGTSCTSEIRSCLNGILSGGYAYDACSVGVKSSCLFDGKTIPDGGQVHAYQFGEVTNGVCTEEVRTCNDGNLTGSFNFGSCASSSSCLFDGMTIPSGDDVTAYRSATEPAGPSACLGTKRVCNNGVLSGDMMATFKSCSVVQPLDCAFDGITVKHGSSAVAYSERTVPYGQSCATSQQTRVCSNGVLSGTYAYKECTVAPAPDCPPIGGRVLKQGQFIMTSQYAPAALILDNYMIMNARMCRAGTLWKGQVWVLRNSPIIRQSGIGIIYDGPSGGGLIDGTSYKSQVTDFSGADIPSPILFYSGITMPLLYE